jgi:hypothetical protein
MSTIWIYRFSLIVSAAEKATANYAAQQLTGDPPGSDNFSIPLSADGTGDPTHWACSIAVTEVIRQGMEPLFEAGLLTSLQFWRTDSQSHMLQATTSPDALQHIGLGWDMAHSLKDAGLQIIAPPTTIFPPAP